MAIFAPLIAPYDPLAQHAGSELLPPNAQFWLGTDQFGRDELSRIMYGAQVSFIVAIAATAVGAVVGVLAGLLAGYARGGVDSGGHARLRRAVRISGDPARHRPGDGAGSVAVQHRALRWRSRRRRTTRG